MSDGEEETIELELTKEEIDTITLAMQDFEDQIKDIKERLIQAVNPEIWKSLGEESRGFATFGTRSKKGGTYNDRGSQ